MDEVFMALLDDEGEQHGGGVSGALAHFAGPQGDVLRVEGWWEVTCSSKAPSASPTSREAVPLERIAKPCFCVSTDVALPRRASVLLLRHTIGACIVLDKCNYDNTANSTTGTVNTPGSKGARVSFAAQIQIVSFGHVASSRSPPPAAPDYFASNHDIAAAGQAGTQEGGVANAAVDTFFHAIERLTRACLMPVIQEAAKLLALEKTRNEKVDGLDVDVDDVAAACWEEESTNGAPSAASLLTASAPAAVSAVSSKVELRPLPSSVRVQPLHQQHQHHPNQHDQGGYGRLTRGVRVSDVDVRLAHEVLQRVAQLRGALEALRKESSIRTLRLEIHHLIARQLNERGYSGSNNDALNFETAVNMPIDELGLGADSLQFGDAPGREREKRHAHFLNALQWLVTSQWKKEVGRLASMIHDPFHATCRDEMAFWVSLQRALKEAQVQFNMPGVRCMLDILRLSNRNIHM